jgi:hypothetical protein
MLSMGLLFMLLLTGLSFKLLLVYLLQVSLLFMLLRVGLLFMLSLVGVVGLYIVPAKMNYISFCYCRGCCSAVNGGTVVMLF